MYRVTTVFLLFAAVGFAADVSGKWVGNSQLAKDRSSIVSGFTLDLSQTGAEVTGTVTAPPEKPVKIEHMRVENDSIVLWFHTHRNVLTTGRLIVKDGAITGRLTSSSGEVVRIALRKE